MSCKENDTVYEKAREELEESYEIVTDEMIKEYMEVHYETI